MAWPHKRLKTQAFNFCGIGAPGAIRWLVSLGSKIDDGLAHRWGQYVTPDGKYLFYSHGTSAKDCAIYWVRFDTLLKELRSQ